MNTNIRNMSDFLDLLKGVKQVRDDQYTALCPGHHDIKPSLSIKRVDSKILVKCFAGCELSNILKPLGLRPRDIFLDDRHAIGGIGGSSSIGEGCQPVTQPQKQSQKGLTPSMSTVSAGVNLSTIAEAKHLPVDFLKSLGIGEIKYSSQAALRIPYYSEDGQEIAVRFRLSLTGDNRFKWRKGDRTMPYGLNRLNTIKKAGWVLIVEGESDYWTCLLYDIPSLAAPGKGIWPTSWGEYLKGLKVFVWQEPDAEDFTLRLLESASDLRYIRAPDGIKDISDAHVKDINIPSLLKELKKKAESGQSLKARYDNERLAQLYTEAKTVLEVKDPLELIENTIRNLGYGGDIRPAIIVYLAATSRLLAMRAGAMPVHLLIMGVSSSGKSYTLRLVLNLFPEEAYHVISAGSPRTIIYDDTDLQHKLLVFGEADSLPAGEDNPAASAIRNLLQDHSLHYEVTVRDVDTGDYIVRKVVKPGPTVLITTSTRSLGHQLMTRLFSLEIGDSKEQIGAALETQATLETEDSKPLDGTLVAFQHYLQLKAPFKIIVPFVKELAKEMGKMASAPRILRDFARLLSLIKSVTIIRHHWRQTDNEGRLLATLADYETVRELVNEMYVHSSTGATSQLRTLVEAVIELQATRSDGKQITNTTLAKHLGTGATQVRRRAMRAIKAGWLVNREQRKSYPADYAPGEPIPQVEGLPTLEGLTGLPSVMSAVFEAKTERVDTLTPLTDDDTSPHTPDNDYAAVLGISVKDAIKIWRSEGAPLIHLGPRENCLDLEELLARPNVNEHHLPVVKQWLEERVQ